MLLLQGGQGEVVRFAGTSIGEAGGRHQIECIDHLLQIAGVIRGNQNAIRGLYAVHYKTVPIHPQLVKI